MNRRGFLGLLGGTAAVAVAAPAALIEALEPPKRTIFLPPHGGWWFSTEKMTFKTTERFAYGFMDQRALAQSMIETKEQVAGGIMSRADFARELQQGLNEVFEKASADLRMFGSGFVKMSKDSVEHVPAREVYLTEEEPRFVARYVHRIYELTASVTSESIKTWPEGLTA